MPITAEFTLRNWGTRERSRRALLGVAIALVLAAGCSRVKTEERLPVSAAVAQTSASCRECHETFYHAWSGTDHALANRTMAAAGGAAEKAFAAQPLADDGGSRFALAWTGGQPRMTELRSDGTRTAHAPEFILGARPLWQPLVPAPGGRWQPTDLAYDVKRGEWFNVFGQEHRHAGEWGHWTGRGMNWNSMCAQCHMTGYVKNYDAAADRYASTWVEHGVGCIQCHGAMPAGHNLLPKKYASPAGAPPPPPFRGDRVAMMQTCAPCHARNEPLAAGFEPGDNYFDFYRLQLPSSPATFYPDGQQRDEDFNWTSFQLSRMGAHGGVTCLDCHDPHSTKTVLPTDNNQLCLQCHAPPGRVQPNGVRAVPIEPLGHSHHKDGSAGNSCVACHMPTTNYMQRAPRHDHGWLLPDPLLNKELGVPDACSRCHTDKPVEWSIAATDSWYGAKMETRQRQRTRAIAAMQANRADALAGLLAVWPREDIPVWRATMLELMAGHEGEPRVAALAREALRDASPLVRAAAVRLLGRGRGAEEAIRPLLADPVRSVRIEAAWIFSAELAEGSAARRELDAYLRLNLDQPAGRALLGQDFANRGRFDEAVREMAKAVEWDGLSPGLRQTLGMVLASRGNLPAAAGELARAAELAPGDAVAAMNAALAFAEAGNPTETERYLRVAIARDAGLHRAWYNLGLLLAQQEKLAAAIAALQEAERLAPAVAEYPSALATVFVRTGEMARARAAAGRALALDGSDPVARRILGARE